MSTFPSILTTYTNPNPTDRLNAPSHAGIETAQNSGLMQLEAVVGTTSSALGTLTYDVRAPTSNGGGHIQTANKGGTGQTIYAKGDLLVGQSTSVLSKLSIGLDSAVLVADSTQQSGVKWGSAGENITKPSILTYTTSSVGGWIKPSLLSYIMVEVVGGGGGGGGGIATNAGSAGGGGAGGYGRRRISASVLGLSENITVGVGGPHNGANQTGSVGGVTVFGASSLLSATGGLGGAGGTNGAGGDGGVSTNGDVGVTGGQGTRGFNIAANANFGGTGGGSYFGGGAAGGNESTGSDALVFGAGGGGGAGNGQLGGNGKNGIVIVTNYFA